MAWGKTGSETLTSAGDDNDITSMTASTFIQILNHNLQSGNTKPMMTFNNTAGVYAIRYNFNGDAASGDSINQSAIWTFWNEPKSWDRFTVTYGCSISGEEKLQIVHNVETGGSGDGNDPERMILGSKFVPSDLTETITRVDVHNDSTGDFAIDSNVSVLGSDMTPAAAADAKVQDGAIFEETDTNKHYLLDDGTWTEI